ncbi:uncharacterized protein LOC112086428 [Eutrema salsugineum]|uniref:uncharacterized protein LOC112086428 n=1 Tax=Eutrema salsugineum TaxID=72664 RepID=UPI000CED44B0|nr:uncharacterized protein LOC112086428 [Eutrema salsugineum]
MTSDDRQPTSVQVGSQMTCADETTQVGGPAGQVGGPVEERKRSPVQPQPEAQQIKAEPSSSAGAHQTSPAAFDPTALMNAFAAQMQELFTSAEQKDAIQCQLFVEHLEGIALDWFSRLEADSIDNYKELSTKFAKHFSMFIGQKTRNSELWEISQGENESLRDFMARFKQIVAHCTVDDEAALEALYQKTWYKSPFHNELRRNRPLTLEDALHKSNIFIAEEEEEAVKDRQYSTTKPGQTPTPKESSETKFRKGEIDTADLPKPGPRRPNPRPNKPGNQEAAKAADSDEEQVAPPKRDREAPNREANVPKTRKKVNMIMGALESCNYSVRALKEYSRQASSSQPQTTVTTVPLLFTEADLRGVHMPHNDCLVVELQLGDVEVSRILIDTGSSVNVIFKETLKNMDFPDSEIKPYMESLTGFTGEKTRTVGTVKIPIYVGGSARMIKFLVLNKPAIYNAILGMPWLFDMKAVASTFHQCVKFSTPSGIFTLKGSQTVSRLCHLTECKLSLARTCVISPFQEGRTAAESQFGPPKQSQVDQVCIDPTDPEKCVGIGAELDNSIREALISFLQKNVSTFAWNISDMPGINPDITCHKLNIDPTYKPIKQKRPSSDPRKREQ